MNALSASEQIIGFSRFLRNNGFHIGVADINDSLQALASLPAPDKSLSEHYLRSVFCRSKKDWDQFHILFDHYWEQKKSTTIGTEQKPADVGQASGAQLSGIAGSSTDHFRELDKSSAGTGAGKQNTIGKADFRFLKDPQAMQEVERLAEQLAQLLRKKIKRQRRIVRQGRNIDMRHTLRASLPYGGMPIQPRYSLQVRMPPRIAVLHDVSHSMSWNNPLLFRFVRGLAKTFTDTEVFVFHTQLYHVSELFREKSLEQMKEKLEEQNDLWLGGTCIAESLSTFNREYKSLLSHSSHMLIISDGFDTDGPEKLADELRRLKQRCRKIIWLNPMLAREGYQPDEASMVAAKPYVDAFVPAHSLDALQSSIKHLC